VQYPAIAVEASTNPVHDVREIRLDHVERVCLPNRRCRAAAHIVEPAIRHQRLYTLASTANLALLHAPC